MIKNNKQLKQTRDQLARLEEDLIALREEIYPINPKRFFVMAEAYIDHILELRRQIDEYVGIKLYQDKLEGIWLRIVGPSIQLGTASASILANTIENFRKSIRSIAAIIKGEKPFLRGGVSQDVEKSCDLVIVGLMPGSLKVGLGLPPERQLNLLDKSDDPATKAIDIFMEIASWASTLDDSVTLPPSIDNLSSRNYILKQVMNVAPSKRTPVEIIEFSGTLVHISKPPRLTRESRVKIHDFIVKETGTEYIEAVGTIREIDLDSLTFDLRDRPNNEPNLLCEVKEEMIEDAKAALGERVRIAGTLERKFPRGREILKVKTLEILSNNEKDM